MVSINKTGIASLVIGIVLILGVYFVSFPNNLFGLVVATVQGGFVLLGLFLILIGILMMTI